jgi:hypothetical protein
MGSQFVHRVKVSFEAESLCCSGIGRANARNELVMEAELVTSPISQANLLAGLCAANLGNFGDAIPNDVRAAGPRVG